MTAPRPTGPGGGFPLRTLLLATLGVAVFAAVVVLLYDRGLLPIAGVFLAMAVGPLIVLWRRAGLARRRARLSQDVLDRLARILGLVDAERRTPETGRASGATTSSLLDADEATRAAVQRFAWGDEAGAAASAAAVVSLARTHAWRDGPLTRAVGDLDRVLADLDVVLGKLEKEATRAARGARG